MLKALLTTLLLTFTLSLCHGADFPRDLGEWELMGVTVYDNPDAGFSVSYQRPDSSDKLDIYFYDNGQQDLGTGLSDAASKEFAMVFAGINEMQRRGYYADVSKPQFGQGKMDLWGEEVPLLFGRVSYRQTDKANGPNTNQDLRQSFTILTAYKDRYLKVRFTVISDDADAAFAQFNHIMGEIERSFDRRPTAALIKKETGTAPAAPDEH
ncbi:hypothetical protein [Ruficoccus sp. ZRK36]|uniref:hypothetical protein n=1 Tax=Ruficoccus sp. ZRK36 TaxID=2866311 RepID=UPI001C738A71|nr:hypothetical protein [Ruficoccus sp. ZRK36]QYY36487.1 hypothetical protein K0V07_03220 [Ruficoccus sp. ZRK36]